MSQVDAPALVPVHSAPVEVLPAEPRRSTLGPLVGGALLWMAHELLPPLIAARVQPAGSRPAGSNQRPVVSWRAGHRHRWG
jgi:hypothetical protein